MGIDQTTAIKKPVQSIKIDLTPYAGRWVALVRGRVAGVGWTAEEARRSAKRSRPKEEPQVLFVPTVENPDATSLSA